VNGQSRPAAGAPGASPKRIETVVNDFTLAELPAARMTLAEPAHARFIGRPQAYRKLVLRGALLQVVTFGLYRFWLTTDARRFLWANTEVGGDSLEYTGTAMELFLGFLMAVALLVPIYVLLFIGSLDLEVWSRLSSGAAFLFFAVFGQYAYYRARRYRLTRTVFRGVRLRQTGSAWGYVLRSLLWSVPVVATAGLAYPWAQASLERYKMSNTRYGDLRGSFAGTGASLFVRGIAMWLIAAGAVVGAIVAIGLIADDPSFGLDADDAPLTPKGGFALGAIALMLAVVGLGVYGMLQAIVAKWWLAGVQFGTVTVATSLKKRQIAGAYLRYTLYLLLILVVLIALFAAGTTSVRWTSTKFSVHFHVSSQVMTAAAIFGYMIFTIAAWVAYQVTVKLRIWRLMVASVTFAGFAAVEGVRADLTQPSSAMGEGLADALGAGGI
jgi:uncharacterized membrane protein YjgN (DUF898 family)